MVRHHYTTTQLIAKEGWNHIVFTFIGFSSFVCVVRFFHWFFFFVLVVTIYIYRNPERIVEESDELTLLSPVDGTILKISKVDLKDGSEALCVVIRKSIWDVGILRAPIGMEIIEVKNRFGLFISSGSSLFSNLCERKTFTCKNKFTSFKIVVSAGRLSQSIVFFNKNAYKANERFGFLREGEVALLLPLDVRIKVSLNHSVKAGESVLGYLAYKDNHDKQ